jgi:hypothetical protein
LELLRRRPRVWGELALAGLDRAAVLAAVEELAAAGHKARAGQDRVELLPAGADGGAS